MKCLESDIVEVHPIANVLAMVESCAREILLFCHQLLHVFERKSRFDALYDEDQDFQQTGA